MDKGERQRLIKEMGDNLGRCISYLDAGNMPAAYVNYARVVSGLGVLGIALDEAMEEQAAARH